MLRKNRAIFFLLGAMICTNAFSQKHNFIYYNTDQGLPQSQVLHLTQSADRQLWLSTWDGISRFDGKTFYNYTTSEGLSANFTIHFVSDHRQRIWAISNSNLNLIEGNKIYSYTLPENVIANRASLAVTNDNILWCLINGVLYSFRENRFKKEEVKDFPKPAFLNLLTGEKNTFLMGPQRTLLRYTNGTWQFFTKLILSDSLARINNVFIDSVENVWILTQNELLVKKLSDPVIKPWFRLNEKGNNFFCFTRDRAGNFWLGGTSGAYKIRPDRSFMHFDYTNGFSNYTINDITTDTEGNIWLASDGDGLIRYSGGIFTSYENIETPGINKVQCLTGDSRGNIFYGNKGNDFGFIDGHTKKFLFRNTVLKSYEFFSTFMDSSSVLWISVTGSGLWKYEKGKAVRTSMLNNVYGFCETSVKKIFATSEGIIEYKDGKFRKNPAVVNFTRCVKAAGRDSLVIAQQYGVSLIKDTIQLNYPFPKELQRTIVDALEVKDDKVFIGNIGRGLFIWNKISGRFSQLTAGKELATNIIYSLKFDGKGQLWAGTGKGVSRIVSDDGFNTFQVRNYGKEKGFNGLECNSNAIGVKPDNTVWFGTARGLYCYHPEGDPDSFSLPKLFLSSVKLFSRPLLSPDTLSGHGNSALPSLPGNLVLAPGQNHVTFDFYAISYAYANLRYSYFLEGLEKNFSVPDLTNFVVYPALPPGGYTFNVRVTDESGKQLGETVRYSFRISRPFYQTTWFILLLVLIAAIVFWLLYYLRNVNRARQQKMIDDMRAEEQKKIRKNTAQDFHDEMGNKLARITVLSDILKTRLPAGDDTQGLAKKIQENVALLYEGTKDIIWSLNPENDNLYFLLKHISDFGIDTFSDTDIEFAPIAIKEEFKSYFLPMDFERNIIMICKEAYTNILKHAHAKMVSTGVCFNDTGKVKLAITDDGKGFDVTSSYTGNGLINIKQRAALLNADIEWRSLAGTGTIVTLIFGLPPGRDKK